MRLKIQTVIAHLASYIQKGELSVNDFVELEKQKTIREIAYRIGTENGKKAIKELCPSDITYADITLTLADDF